MSTSTSMADKRPNVALVLLRCVAGGVLFYEGLAKLIADPDIVATYFQRVGFPAPDWIGGVITLFELIVGLLIAIGLFSRVLSMFAAAEMVVAAFIVNIPLVNIAGAEVNALLFAAFMAIALMGSGRFAVCYMLPEKFGGKPLKEPRKKRRKKK